MAGRQPTQRDMIVETATTVKELRKRLYGEEADKGDIPGIIDHLAAINSCNIDQDKFMAKNREKIVKLEGKVKVLLVMVASGGGIAGVLKAIGVY